MNNLLYPALFKQKEHGYSVTLPDIKGCKAEGATIEQAYENIVEAIGNYIELCIETNSIVPSPSSALKLHCDKDEMVMVVEFNMLAYQKRHDNRTVKKTLSIPKWLNDYAVRENINFSQVLKKALIAELELEKL